MLIFSWSKAVRQWISKVARTKGLAGKENRRRVRCGDRQIEQLEDRCLLSTITVTSLADNTTVDGNVTLREALQAANTNQSVDGSVAGQSGIQDQIVFQTGLNGTIQFSGGQMTISDTVQITGLGATSTVVNANGLSRVFYLSGSAGNVTLSGLTVTGGRTNSNSDRGGGILSRSAGTLTLINSVVSGNMTNGQSAYGGGVYSQSGGVTLTSSTISGNSTTAPFGRGGGLFVSGGAVTLTNSTISGNSTAGSNATGGGIGAANNATITATNSTISGNSTAGSNAKGGGVYAVSGAVTLTSSTLSGNSTAGTNASGGGIYSQRGNVTLNNSIVAGNVATVSTNADIAFINAGGTAALVARHSLIGSNQGTPLVAAPVGAPDVNGNLIGTPAALLDPKLGALANNGGPTLTRALLSGSPAIDAGDNSLAVGLTTDQRGGSFSRIVNGTVDMGAFEGAGSSVTLSINPAAMAEAAGVSTVTATLSAVSGLPTTVTLGFTGSAVSGNDYTSSASQIVIPAGSLSATMTLTAMQDALFEGHETVVVDITGVTNGTENGVQQVTATIVDDDVAPLVSLTLSPANMAEAAGQSTVTASLTAVSGLSTTVFLGFSGTATNVTDYTRSAVQIVIPAGSLSGTITLTALQDTLSEGNETVIVDITSVTNGTESGSQQVTETIIDDDAFPSVTLARSPATMAEASGVSTVTATLSVVSGLNTTILLGFTGTAANGIDYTPSASQIVIPAGSLSGTMTLTALQDTLFEGNETVIVDITSVTNGTESGTQQVTSTIVDDDTAPLVSLSGSPTNLAEASGVGTVTATLSAVSGFATTVTLGYSGLATEGIDYTHSATQIIIPAGSLSGTTTLTVIQDTLFEGNESLFVDVIGVTNGTENGFQRADFVIIDDDVAPLVNLTISPPTLTEASGVSTVTATLTAVSGKTTTVFLGFTGSAINVTDYTASAAQIVIPAGSLSGTITLTAVQDTLFGGNETIIVDITGLISAVENGIQQVTATIIDDDSPPTVALSLSPTTMAEAAGVTTVTATLSAVSGFSTTVLLGFTGTATNATDYTRSVEQIVIPAGSLSGTLTLAAVQDTISEGNETVIVDITSVTNGTESGTQQVTATIIDDDTVPLVNLSLSTSTLAENGGSVTATATQSTLSALNTTVTLVASAMGANGDVYPPFEVQIVIPAGQLTGSFTYTAALDGIYANNISVVVDITGVTNGIENGVQQVTATVLDGDTAPTVVLTGSSATIAEDGGVFTLTATQSKLSAVATTVFLGFSGTSLVGSDYTLSGTQIVIPAGQLSAAVTLTAILDGVYAESETVIVDITGVTNGAEDGVQQVTATIIDGDTAPTVNLSLSASTIAEDGGTSTATATQSTLSALDTTVTLVATITATNGAIIPPRVVQIVIPAGQLTGSLTYTGVLDGVYANNLTVVIDISSVTNGSENGVQQVTGTIIDGDTAPTVILSASSATIAEDGGVLTLTATQSKLSAVDTTVFLGFSGTSISGSDYTLSAAQIVIPAGQLTGSITATSILDGVFDRDETIIVDVSGVTNGAEDGVQQVTATIIDGDTAPVVNLSLSTSTLAENGGNVTATVTQSTLSNQNTTVTLVASATGANGVNYPPFELQLVIPAGQLSAAFVYTSVLDGVYANNISVVVDITAVTNATENGVQQVTATVLDGDTAPTVTLAASPATIAEDGGVLTLTATQSKLSAIDTTVFLGFSGTAISGSDYTLSAAQIVIPAGQLTGSITATSILDGVFDSDETIIVDVSGVTNGAEDGVQQVTATVLDGDTAPTVALSVSPLTLAENGGSATITATQSTLSTQNTVIDLAYSGTATMGDDYTSSGAQIVILAGQLTGSLVLTAVQDAVFEGNETVIVDITSVTNGTESGAQQVTATIIDGAAAPTVDLSVSASTLAENGGTIQVTATQSILSIQDTTVYLGYSGTATPGSDYTLSDAQIVIPAGQLSASITLTASLDGVFANNETVIIDISGIANGAENGTQQATATIIDGDTAPTVILTSNSTMIAEDGGTVTATATQSTLSSLDTTVTLVASAMGANGDVYPPFEVQIVIPAGQLTGSFTYTAALDGVYANNISVVVDITGVTNGTENGVQQVTATVLDGDTAPTVILTGSSATIAEDGGVLTLTATQSKLSAVATTVFLGFSGTSLVGSDYTLSGTQIVIPAGQLSAAVTLTAMLDGVYAESETVIVDITGVTNGAEVGVQEVTATIIDGDAAPLVNLSLSTSTLAENGGSVTATATQSTLSSLDTTVTLVASAMGANGDVYPPFEVQIVIPAGQLTGSFTYTAALDGVYANNISVVVDITAVTNGTENGVQQVTATVLDGDTAPTVILSSSPASPATIAEDGGVFTLTATQSKLSAVDTTVFLGFSGTSILGSDYTLSDTEIVIPAGQLSAAVTLTAMLDGVYAEPETVIVDVTGVTSGAEDGVQEVTATIIDGDTAPIVNLSLSTSTIAEDGGTATVTATQSTLSALDTTVTLVATITATNGAIIPPRVVQIVIPAGQLTGSLTYTGVLDGVYANNLTVVIDISTVTNGTENGVQQVTGTIIDGDTAPTVILSASPATIAEDGGVLTLTATQSKLSAVDTTVFLGFSGTAISGSDYTLSAAQIVIPAGQLTGSITATSILDGVFDRDETIIVDVSGVTNGAEDGVQQVTATIIDGDTAPTVALSVSPLTLAENGGTTTVTATQSALSNQDTIITLAYSGTATLGGDYTPSDAQIVIPAGQLTGSISLGSVQDLLFEGDETILMDVSGVTNGTELGTQQATATILDDDVAPTVTLSAALQSIAEASGTTMVTAQLSVISGQDVTVDLAFSGTASNLSDYTRSGTQIVIPAGQLTGTITLDAVQDVLFEEDETIVVEIGSVANATDPGAQQATVTIIDDDSAPGVTLTVTPVDIVEAAGTATVTATLSAISGQDVTIDLAFSGTSTNLSDYTRSGTEIVIPAGQLTGSITLNAVQDFLFEGDETIVVDVSGVTNGMESGAQQVTATILDDDTAPTVILAVTPSSIIEAAGTGTVTATLSAISGLDVTIDLGFSGTATNLSDYTRSGTQIVIPAGQLTGSITLVAVQDALFEGDETIVADVAAVSNGMELGTQQATATILDDDLAPTVSLSAGLTNIAEASGTTTVTAQLSAISGLDVTIDLGFSGTATNLSDYTRSGTQIVIPAGQLTGSITLVAVQDALFEVDETIVVGIGGVTNGTESGTQLATVTIADDDVAPSASLSVIPLSIAEADGTATVTVTLSAISGLDVVVDLQFSGTAANLSDYTLSGTQIVIPAGQLTGMITLVAVQDALFEGDETIVVDVTSMSNATESGAQQGTVTILDDDVAPTVTLSVGLTSIPEAGGFTTVVATLSTISGLDVTVDLAFGGLASNLSDYTRSGTKIVILAGQLTGSITLETLQDSLIEGDETVVVNISGVTDGTEFGTQQVTTTIIDDDNTGTSSVELGVAGVYRVVRNVDTIEIYNSGNTLVFSRLIGTDGLVIIGTVENDTLIVDFSGGNFPVPITFNGVSQVSVPGDSLILTNGSFDTGSFAITNGDSGSVDLLGNSLINYTGLQPIDTTGLTINNVNFNFDTGDETIVLTDATGAAMTIVGTPGANITFADPSNSLTINAGTGNDTVNAQGVDAAYAGSLTINGDYGIDTVNFQANPTNLLGGALTVTADVINIVTSLSTGGGTINMSATGDLTVGPGVSINSGSGTQTFGAGLINLQGQIVTVNANVALNSAVRLTGLATIDTGAGVGNISFAGTVNGSTAGAENLTLTAGTGNIVFAGQVGSPTRVGAVTINSAANVTTNVGFSSSSLTQAAGSGSTTINGFLNTNTSSGVDIASNYITFNGVVTTTNNGTVRIRNASDFQLVPGAGAISSDGAVTQTGAGLSLVGGGIVTTNDAISFASDVYISSTPVTISAGNGDVAFAKLLQINNKTLTLRDGNSVDLGSRTTIANGTVNVFVGSSATVGSLTMGNGEIFTGTGTVNATLNVGMGATLTPSSATTLLGTGILTFHGDVNLASGSVYNVELNGVTAGAGYDQIAISGAGNEMNITAGAVLQATRSGTFSPSVGTALTILDGVNTVNGTFTGAANGSVLFLNGAYFTVSYNSPLGDIVLTSVAAPGGAAKIIDNDEASGSVYSAAANNGTLTFSPASAWSFNTVAGRGFTNDLRFASATSNPAGTAFATYTFNLSPNATYRVSATWFELSNRATNAKFTVSTSGAGGSPDTLVTLNQRNAPNSFTASNAKWQDLSTAFTVGDSGVLTIRLSNYADGYVIADAIRVEAMTAAGPEVQVVNTTTGNADLANISGTVDFGTTTQLTDVTRIITIKNVGSTPLILGSATLAAPAGFQITGYAPTSLAAGASLPVTIKLSGAIVGNFAGSVSFQTNDSDENPFTFNLIGNVVSNKVWVIDNPVSVGSAGSTIVATPSQVIGTALATATYGETGTWYNNTDPGVGFMQDLRFATAGSASTATWTFGGLTAGALYRVSVTYRAEPNRASNALFTVSDGTEMQVQVDQRNAPSDFLSAGVYWKDLVTSYVISGTTLTITLNAAGTNGYVIADAVRVEQIAPLTAASGITAARVVQSLSNCKLQRIANEAIDRWKATGLTDSQRTALSNVVFQVQDLPQGQLGIHSINGIYIDRNAAGHGWFVDRSRKTDREFERTGSPSELHAVRRRASAKMDLLTVVMHELGHTIGMGPSTDPTNIMAETLGVGTRRIPLRVNAANHPVNTSADSID